MLLLSSSAVQASYWFRAAFEAFARRGAKVDHLLAREPQTGGDFGIREREKVPQRRKVVHSSFESRGDGPKRSDSQIGQQPERRSARCAGTEQERVPVARRKEQNLGPQAFQLLPKFQARGGRGRGVGRKFRCVFLPACGRRRKRRLLDAGEIRGNAGQAREVDRPRECAENLENEGGERMGGKRAGAQAAEAALDVGRIGQPVARARCGQTANGGAIRGEPEPEAVAGFDGIAKPFAQAAAFGKAPGEEAVDSVGGDSRRQRIERKIGRAGRARTERPQAAQQFQHRFARKFGGIGGRIERPQAAAYHALRDRMGEIDEQALQHALGVIVRIRRGEIALEEFLASHNIRGF